MAVKAAVNKELENQRNAKVIGGNLQAEVTLYAEDALVTELAKGNELRFVLITSAVRRAAGAGACRGGGERVGRPQAVGEEDRARQVRSLLAPPAGCR